MLFFSIHQTIKKASRSHTYSIRLIDDFYLEKLIETPIRQMPSQPITSINPPTTELGNFDKLMNVQSTRWIRRTNDGNILTKRKLLWSHSTTLQKKRSRLMMIMKETISTRTNRQSMKFHHSLVIVWYQVPMIRRIDQIHHQCSSNDYWTMTDYFLFEFFFIAILHSV
jgi:hypothetical protein